MEDKVGLIVEGGGFKSAFTAGVLDAFLALEFYPFNILVGISGGALNLSSFLSRQYKRNIEIIQKVGNDTSFISIARYLKGGDYMNLDRLINLAQKSNPLNMETFLRTLKNKTFYIVVTDVENGKPLYLEINEGILLKALKATSSIPMLVRDFNTIDGKKVVDGGFSDPLPVKWSYSRGIKKIIIIRTHPEEYEAEWNLTDLVESLFYKQYPKFKKLLEENHSIYKKTMEFIKAPPSDLEVIQIAPENDLLCTTISQSDKYIINDYRHGLDKGLDFIKGNNL